MSVITLKELDPVPVLTSTEARERFPREVPPPEEVRRQGAYKARPVVAVSKGRAIFEPAMLVHFTCI